MTLTEKLRIHDEIEAENDSRCGKRITYTITKETTNRLGQPVRYTTTIDGKDVPQYVRNATMEGYMITMRRNRA